MCWNPMYLGSNEVMRVRDTCLYKNWKLPVSVCQWRRSVWDYHIHGSSLMWLPFPCPSLLQWWFCVLCNDERDMKPRPCYTSLGDAKTPRMIPTRHGVACFSPTLLCHFLEMARCKGRRTQVRSVPKSALWDSDTFNPWEESRWRTRTG